jgi:CRISPR type IV-associated protein Csf3
LSPLRLTWELATPMVVGAYPLHLDGLIAFAMSQEAKQIDFESWDDQADLILPIQREVRANQRCWKASALLPTEPGEHSMRFWTRKSDAYDYATRLKAGHLNVKTKFPLKPYAVKFDTARGTFKQMLKFFPVRQIHQVQAYCVGDMDRLAELLAPESGYITYLGAKARMGYGRIKSFSIDADEQAEMKWKLRVMPWPEEGTVQVEAASAMPYHEVSNRGPAWVSPDLYN